MSSGEQTFRIRRVTVDPTATPVQERSDRLRCPHCGEAVPAADPAVESAASAAAEAVDLPEAEAVWGVAARVVVEVLDQRRPLAHLDGVVAPSVRRYVRASGPASRARASRVLSLRVCRSSERAVEAAAVVRLDRRVRAIAARFERDEAGWCCTAFRIL